MPTVELKNKLKNKNRNANEQRCRVVCFNIDKVNEIKKALPTEKEFGELTNFYSAISNTTRLKIIFALAKGELCVCDIANVLELSIPATSHQLKYLFEMKILKYRNDGKMVYYTLNSERLISILKDDVKLIEETFTL
ncbi:MAG: ArsR/SmtB family transcription factor [Ignavibacteriaceae bacterium]